MIINSLITQKIGILIIGPNQEWKQEINLGKKNNQNFVQIPHTKLIEMLSYKAKMVGIKVILTEESYTSIASFMDNDAIPVYLNGEKNQSTFSGKRVKRGLYRTGFGRLINTDVNGSLNIMRKAIPNVFDHRIEGIVVPPSEELSLRNPTQTLTPSQGKTGKIKICHI